MLVASIFLIFFGLFMILFSVLCWIGNSTIGIAPLIIGLVSLIISIILAVLDRKKRQAIEREFLEKEKDFNSWLTQQGFTVSDSTKDFLIDTVNKKWCKKFEKKIFDFSEAVSANINKQRSNTTNSTGSSSSKGSSRSYSRSGGYLNSRYGSGSSTRNRSGSVTRTSQDTSTYEVLIKTSNIAFPLVAIYCDTDKASAEKICASVDIMRGKKTRNRTKDDNDGEQSENAD